MGYWEQKIAQMLRIVFFSLLFTTIVKCKNEVTLPYYNTPDFTPIFLNKHEAKKLIYHSIADFEFDSDKDMKISKKTFTKVRWSSNYAFEDTIKTLETDRWAACDMLRDIDNVIDYDAIQKKTS